ncbi:MAG: S9 family peptidase [Anaerolineae bacterium]|nr:S9 family peptidase [Anaerolineae bacterium]
MEGTDMSDRVASPPVAKRVPVRLETHGHVRVDPYYWLKDRQDPEVIAYLEAENAYTDAVMAHTEPFQEALFEEIRGRIKQTDMSVPYRMDDYVYYTRWVDGQEYPIYCRKRDLPDAPEEVLIDVNELAVGHEFVSVGRFAVSAGQDLLAYPVDTVGRRFYTIRFKDLATGAVLEDVIPDVTENIAWAEDNKTLFYTKQDPVTLRWHQIYRHAVGTDPADDVLVYEEADETFYAYVFKTRSKGYMVIDSAQTLTNEARCLPAGDPEGEWRVFAPRERGHEYRIDHLGEHFYVRTNDRAKNFRLMRAPVGNTDRAQWEEVIPHRDDVLLEGFELYRDHLVVVERRQGLVQIRIRPWVGGEEHYLDFGEPAYLAYPSDNHDLDTTTLRYTYTSMTTPRSVYDYDMVTREKALRKREEVLGGFDSANYSTERLSAIAGDGSAVPISVVYREGTARDGSAPLLLYGYGSYGNSMDATFDPNRVSLLDRGFVYAIAHIRGGEELGRRWYEDGKLLNKVNTFADFIACAEHLVAAHYTRPDRLFAMGGSAGGLLVGAVTNMRPDLFRGVVALVPFVDVVTTMLDDSIPLTTSEYDEWGNPNDQAYYEYMLSYSPYDNVEAKDYPALLVITSLHDSQVQYWEPAKWVARLRATKTDANQVLLRTKMEAGHGGVSGRYKRYREAALIYAFLLDLVGIHG